ncbi:hypothetical protein GCM10011390_35220 [Aureimonas endophytica]|uniref:Extensin-like C-terminal domain-containing protein n=1 Tax=Aureimonas endophytica TaxID=2027858 RepID=A0A917E801_9HYPH|nr:extensin family protein [Aureimonas endophytica]GGE13088.1 hypothetical protein GCM10011390_35220 [Aureimonas endophytica]
MRLALALAGGFALALPSAAAAQSNLPWSDANPLEGSHPKEKAKPPARKEARSEAAKPAETPKEKPGEAAKEKALPAPTASAAAPADVPVPSPNPQEAAPKPADGKPEAAPAGPPPPPAEPQPVPGRPNELQPAPAETKPVEEIPVPEKRPADAPVEAAPAPGQPSGGETAGPPAPAPNPAPPQDAPNSTEKLKSREPVIDPATSVVAAAAIEDAKECEAELKRRGVAFTVGESISEGECGVLRPVAVERLSSGVKVGPRTQMLCRAALALDIWMSDSVEPAAKANFPDRKLTEFRQASTYVCRPRASETGISEHARGSAIDIGGFVFDKGPEIGVAAKPEDSPETRFEATVRAGACGPFKTVLGPGTDPDHATHFHLDIAARRNGATYCK